MYTTVSAVKDELGIAPSDSSLDNFIQRKIQSYSSLFDQMVGQILVYRPSIVLSVSQPSRSRRLLLPDTPVLEVHEISLKGSDGSVEVIDPTTYFLEDGPSGFVAKRKGVWASTEVGTPNIRREPSQQGLQLYEITCDVGYVTPQQVCDDSELERSLPHDIEDAIIQAVVSAYSQRGVDSSISSIKVGDASTTFSVGAGGLSKSRQVPDYLIDVASRYKRLRSF